MRTESNGDLSINVLALTIVFLASVFFAIVCSSLRNFLRSRLAATCRIHRLPRRFGEILKHDENALHASQFIYNGLAIVLLFFLFRRILLDPTANLWVDVTGVAVLGWIFWHVLPWTVSRVAAETILVTFWPVIYGYTLLLSPFIQLIRRVDTLTHRIAGMRDPIPESIEALSEEIQSVVDEGEREGLLSLRTGRMVQRVMDLQDEDVRAIMTPRPDLVTIQENTTLEQARQVVLETGHSRIPVVAGSPDDITGILYARDLLELMGEPVSSRALSDIVRPPIYVPETTSVAALLEQMQQQQLHLAIVLDEYGGVTGLVTLEDILEIIVGDIDDEFDQRQEQLYEVLDQRTLHVDARVHLSDLNEAFGLELPDEDDFETLAGFVLHELKRIPKAGERMTWNDLQFTVLEANNRMISKLEVKSFGDIPMFEESGEIGLHTTEPIPS